MSKAHPYNAARYNDEPYDVYTLRRQVENNFYKNLLLPLVLWYSRTQGTYKKKDANVVY